MSNTLFKGKPNFTEIDPVKLFYNVGSLLDIPTGTYVKGKFGENILNGGLGVLTAIAGRGNMFKSTLAHYMVLSAADKVMQSGHDTYINTNDTEMNIHKDRLAHFSKKFKSFANIDIFKSIWSIIDKTCHSGNEWFKMLKEFLRTEKIKNRKEYTFETPLIDKDGKQIRALFPSFGQIDSISEFETSNIEEIQNKNELGESGGNTIHMQLGLAKTRLLMELPGLCNAASHYMVLTAHIGTEINMASGPYAPPNPKKLQHLRQGEKIKGVTDKFFFLPNIFWQTVNSSLLNNQTTKGPEYPKARDNPDEGSQDLNIVTVKQLRNKSGPSGMSIDIIVSQIEGILPSLTEFHYIKENERFGLEGNNVTYNLILYPDIKLARTTVRSLIDSDAKLRRAIKITADLLQIKQIYKQYDIQVPDVKELYEKIGKEYDWNILLETRDFWTFNNYEHPIPFLSTLDLIEMYNDRYIPYFLR